MVLQNQKVFLLCLAAAFGVTTVLILFTHSPAQIATLIPPTKDADPSLDNDEAKQSTVKDHFVPLNPDILVTRKEKIRESVEQTKIHSIPLNGDPLMERKKYFCEQTSKPVKMQKPLFSLAMQKMPTYLPEFKNPCWRRDYAQRRLRNPLRCVPYAYLAVSCYVRYYAETYFSVAAQDILVNEYNDTDLESPVQHSEFKYDMITLDGSASTAWDNQMWYKFAENQGCSTPVVLNADFIVKMNPKVKMIFILRDPVERAFSDTVAFTRRKITPQKFHKHIVRAIHIYNACLKAKESLRKCMTSWKSSWNESRALMVGLYHVYVQEWLWRLPREQLLFLRSEDYYNDMERELAKVFDFLELPRLTKNAISDIANAAVLNFGRKKAKIGPMLKVTRSLLEAFYRPHNERLAKLLGDDKFTWRKTSS